MSRHIKPRRLSNVSLALRSPLTEAFLEVAFGDALSSGQLRETDFNLRVDPFPVRDKPILVFSQ
jgi:hypothetical protein